MSTVRRKKHATEETKRIEDLLRERFSALEVYRYPSPKSSIRIRLVDPRFEGKNVSEREELVAPLLSQLPEEVERDILMLLMLTPEEVKPQNLNRFSLINREFEDPS